MKDNKTYTINIRCPNDICKEELRQAIRIVCALTNQNAYSLITELINKKKEDMKCEQ